MYSKFWDNVRERLRDKKDGQKGLAGISGVGRTAINNGIARKSSPLVDHAYAIAKALDTTIEELVDGETGAEYVRQWTRNQGGLWEPPPRVAGVMAILTSLNEEELAVATGAMRGAIQAMEEAKKGGGKVKSAANGVAG